MWINLSAWASLVQDVAASLQVLPPGLSNCLDPEILNLLHRLEVVTQVKFCHLCYYPRTNCRCSGVPPLSPPTSWSQIMEQTLGYGMTTSSSGVTTPSTSLGGMSGLVPPPPGISILDPFQWKAPISQKPVTTPPYRPPAGRAKQLKTALSMRGLVPLAPQMAPAICQLPLLPQSRPATPYQNWESPLTPWPPSLLPLTVGTPMYTGDRLPKAEMMFIGLPAIPEEDKRGPPSGRPISQCLTRRVDAQLGHLVISLHPHLRH